MLLPVALQLEGKLCIVVGGGTVAVRKVASLLECAAHVRVIAPDLCADFGESRDFEYHPRRFQSGDCDGAMLVFACTNDGEINTIVADEARRVGAWCNRADDATGSDFHGAATVRRGEICIGISTSGGSPALSRHLKTRIESAVGDEYAALLKIMRARRARLDSRVPEQRNRAALWRSILESAALELLRNGRIDEAQSLVDELIERSAVL